MSLLELKCQEDQIYEKLLYSKQIESLLILNELYGKYKHVDEKRYTFDEIPEDIKLFDAKAFLKHKTTNRGHTVAQFIQLKTVMNRNVHLYNLMEYSVWDQEDGERIDNINLDN